MSLCFGEIEEKTSRAFWDDEDDFENNDAEYSELPDSTCKIVWQTSKNVLQYNLEMLIVVDGPFMKGVFMEGVLAKAECVAKIIGTKCVNRNIWGQLFILDDKILVCICEENLDIVNTFSFTRELFALMTRSKEVMVLASSNVSSHFHHRGNELPVSFLRKLQTDTYKGEPLCERLEQPNIVSGISAQVLSWCQVHRLPAVLYVCYTESDEIDSVTTKPVAQLLSKLNIESLQIHIAGIHYVSSAKSSSLLYT